MSIITPVYNGERFILETIESVLTAEIPIDYEYIVVDDGSTDSTFELVSAYSKKVKIISQKNSGESAAFNTGLQNAIGDFILVLSADDPLLTSDLISKSLKILSEKQDVVAVYPDWRMIDGLGQVVKIVRLPDYSDELLIGRNWCLPGPGVIFRKDPALRIGGRNESLRFTGDFDFWLRLSRVGKIARNPLVLAQWRRSEYSTSISQRGYDMASERIKVVQDFLSTNSIEKKLARKSLSNSYVMASKLMFFDSSISGKKFLIKAFKVRRGWPELASIEIIGFIFLMPLSGFIVRFFRKITRSKA